MEAAAGRSAGLVAAGILVSRLIGFVRTSFLARYLGAGAANDAYTMALKVPNALRNLFGEGTLSAAFVPVYSRLLTRGDATGGARAGQCTAWRAAAGACRC